MVTKKKVTIEKPEVVKKQEKIDQIKKNIKENKEYEPVFDEIRFTKVNKVDLNWVGLGRKFRDITGLNRITKRIKEVKEPEKYVSKKSIFNKIDLMKWYEQYKVIWNKYINKENIDANKRIQEIEEYAER